VPGKRWTDDEVRLLLTMWGVYEPTKVAKAIGRSVTSCREKVGRLGYTKSVFVGTESLNGFCRRTGYDYHQVRRAARALRLRGGFGMGTPAIRTVPYGGQRRWLIYPEHADALEGYLASESAGPKYGLSSDHWARDHDECVECGTVERPHYGGGRCTRCYNRRYIRGFRRRPAGGVANCAVCGVTFGRLKGRSDRPRLTCSKECADKLMVRTRRENRGNE